MHVFTHTHTHVCEQKDATMHIHHRREIGLLVLQETCQINFNDLTFINSIYYLCLFRATFLTLQ